jgi:hypothetical protein
MKTKKLNLKEVKEYNKKNLSKFKNHLKFFKK